MNKKHLIGLDVARFFAAVAVMLYHLGSLYLRDPSRPYLSGIIDVHAIEAWTLSWAKYGWIGVQVFFVISGIVIAASIDGKSARDYVRSRFLRLYPGVWACTAISMLCIIASHQVESAQWLSLWVRSSAIFPIAPWVDGAYWTLPVEITFYCLMLVCIGRSRSASIAMAFALCVMSAAFWCIYLWAPEQSKPGVVAQKIAGNFRFDVAFVQYGIYFGIGILLSRFRSLVVQLAVLVAAAPICFVQIGKTTQHAGEYMNVSATGWIPFAMWFAAIVAIVVSIRFNHALHGVLSQSSVRFVRRIGLATYPLYLLHVTVGFAVMALASKLNLPSLASWGLGALVSIGLSILVADHLEPKVRQVVGAAIDRFGQPVIATLRT